MIDIFDDIKKNLEKMIVRYTVASAAVATTQNKKQMVGITIETLASTTQQSTKGITGNLESSLKGKWGNSAKQKLESYDKKMTNF